MRRLLLVTVLLSLGLSEGALAVPQTALVSRNGPNGAGGNASSSQASDITADGRYVVFATTATDLRPPSATDASDIMLRDNLTGLTELISVPNGADGVVSPFGNGHSSDPSISDDGRFVVWTDTATNLLPGHTLSVKQRVWQRDRVTKETKMVSARSGTSGLTAASDPDGDSNEGEISRDGTVVAFSSFAVNLGSSPDPNATFWDVFTRPVSGGATPTTGIVSTDEFFGDSGADAREPTVASDGSIVMYRTATTQLNDPSVRFKIAYTAGDGSSPSVVDRLPGGSSFPTGDSSAPSLGQGLKFAYVTNSADLGAPAGLTQIIRADPNAPWSATQVARSTANGPPNGVSGRPSISPDGNRVSFESAANNLVASDTNGVADVFVVDLPSDDAQRVSVTTAGAQANGESRWSRTTNAAVGSTSFDSTATNLAPIVAATNIFVRENVTGAPTGTSNPVLSGTGAIGQPMSCSLGAWSGRPTSFVYAWLVDNVVVGGQTASTYTIQAGDGGKPVRCRVTATNAAGSTPAFSNIRIADAPPPPELVTNPGLTGLPKIGNTLTCVPGTYSGSFNPAGMTYRWQRSLGTADFVAINGATGTTYQLQADDAGSRVRCEETANGAGGTATGVSPSKRAAADVPIIAQAPAITAVPIVGQTATCGNDTWANEPQSFTRRWLRGGQAIPGATDTTYAVTSADHGSQLACEVTATNEVGTSAPAVSPGAKVYVGRPTPLARPAVVLDTVGQRATDVRATCQSGGFTDDDGQYLYKWLRGDGIIPGAESGTYQVTVDDLGRDISCSMVATNAVGASDEVVSDSKLVPLPGTGNQPVARLYSAGGVGPYDPANFLAASPDLRETLQEYYQAQWEAAYRSFRTTCGTVTGIKLSTNPTPWLIDNDELRRRTTCAVVQALPPERIVVSPDGIRVRPADGECILGPESPCQPLPIPLNENGVPGAGVGGQVAPDAVPLKVIWDINADGRTDAVCPGNAPVLRSLYERGYYNVRAIMIMPRSEELGQYPQMAQSFEFWPTAAQKKAFDDRRATLMNATDIFGARVTPFRLRGAQSRQRIDVNLQRIDGSAVANILALGIARRAQPFACRTQLDPPQETQRPCIKEAWVGKVHVTGNNICPVSVRKMPAAEDELLPGTVRRQLSDAARKAFEAEGASRAADTARERRARFSERSLLAAQFSGTGAVYGELVNQFAQGPSTPGFDPKKVLTPAAAKNFTDEQTKKLAFSLDQIYLSKEPVKINGVLTSPLEKTSVAFVPSDIRESLKSITNLNIAASKAKAALDQGKLELTKAAGEVIDAQIDDAKRAALDQFKKLNLDQLTESVKKKLNLGPFRLAGIGDIKLADGKATITAFAEFPGLTGVSDDPRKKGNIRAEVTITGDLEGNLVLNGIRVTVPRALLGAIELSNLDMTYDGGLEVKGKLLFPPVNFGVDIKKFRLNNEGTLEILDLDYLAGAGQGIPIGSPVPVYLTALGGGLYLSKNDEHIEARATLSAGPSPGGGCPTVGGQGRFRVGWVPDPFTVSTNINVQVACLGLADVDLKATSDGYITLLAKMGFRAGPAHVNAQLEGALLLPNWMISGTGGGGIDGLFNATMSAVLSNKGLAVCGRGKLLDLDTGIGILDDIGDATEVAGGGSVDFPGGIPPLNVIALLANFSIFTGCDISSYKTVVPPRLRAGAAQAPDGSQTVSVAAGERSLVLSVEGQGAAPKVALRGPDGTTIDVSGEKAVAKTPKKGAGFRVEEADKTVFIVGKPAAGTWTVAPGEGSVGIAKLSRATILPKPKITAKVGGAGASRTLRYDVTAAPGQEVRFVEEGDGGGQQLKVVKRGGKGTVPFTTAEARGTKRRIVAQVFQDGSPRDQITVARFSAPSPKLVKPRVKVRRSGTRVVVSWNRLAAADRYQVGVSVGDGRRLFLTPKGKARQVAVTKVGRRVTLTATVLGISGKGRRGPRSSATLKVAKTKARKRR